MDISITPEELIDELQHQIGNMSMQLAAQNILIRKLQEGPNASAQEAKENEREDDGTGVASTDEGYV